NGNANSLKITKYFSTTLHVNYKVLTNTGGAIIKPGQGNLPTDWPDTTDSGEAPTKQNKYMIYTKKDKTNDIKIPLNDKNNLQKQQKSSEPTKKGTKSPIEECKQRNATSKELNLFVIQKQPEQNKLAAENNMYNIFLRQCRLNLKRRKYIGVTCNSTAEQIVQSVITTGSNIIQTFMTYISTQQSYSDENMKNFITLKEGKPNLTNDYKLIKLLKGYENDIPELKIVIHASMSLSINDKLQYDSKFN
ncbi:9005_t:CDS:2, partial [Racocetra persica]